MAEVEVDGDGFPVHPPPQDLRPAAPPVYNPALPLVLIPLCRKGDRTGIERHLQNGASVQEVDIEGNTPLHVAVEAPRNEVATVQILLESGAQIDAANYLGATPLHYVCLRKSNHRGIANILFEYGATVDAQTLAGKSALHFACEQQQAELVEVLLLFQANPNLADADGNTPLHSAINKAGGRDTVKRQIAELLLNYEAMFQVPNRQGLMPLHLACRGGYIRCVQLFLEREADPTAITVIGETGLHLAVGSDYSDIAQLLVQVAPQMIDCADADGNTALHMAANCGSLDSALVLLRSGADTCQRNNEGKTAFELSKVQGTDLSSTHSPELVQALRDAGKSSDRCHQS